jgi:hypothetical protein
MGYIIVWRNNHRESHIDVDSKGFIEIYSSYENAKKAAEEIERSENEGREKSPWYFNYKIYEEC